MGKKKNRKVISLPKVPLENVTKKQTIVEGNKFIHLKGNDKNIDKCDFNTAFAMAHKIRCCNKS